MRDKISVSDLMPLIMEAFENGKAVVLPVVGTSMAPLLRNGIDSVVIVPVKNVNNLKKREIVLFKNNDEKYTLHRIVGVHKESFDMCGDHQTKKEYKIPKTAVVARASGFVRDGRQFSVKNKFYRFYSSVWTSVIPLRTVLLKINYKIRGRRQNEKKQRVQ